MGTWTTKFRSPALIAGILAIGLAANPAFAKSPSDGGNTGSKRGGAGFASGAVIGAAAGGPIGAVVGATVGGIMGEHSHKKSEALAQRKAEAALLASEVETLNSFLSTIEGKAGAVGSTVQFRTGETAVRDSDRARLAKLGALERMAGVYNDEYPKKGMAFALGNQAKRPQTWQLLGIIRLDEVTQGEPLLEPARGATVQTHCGYRTSHPQF